jgi:hypothetical protein
MRLFMTRGKKPQFAIDVNREGSVHIHHNAFGLGDDITLHSDWLSRMLQPTTYFVYMIMGKDGE